MGKRLIIILILFLFVIGSKSHANSFQLLNDTIQKIIDQDRLKYHIPGIEVSVILPAENSPRNFVSGTTTIHGDTSINSEHLFQIGSETKSFTAALILQLEAAGLIHSIDDPIGHYLFQIPEAWKNITIRQLLNHTSGFVDIYDSDTEQGKRFYTIQKQTQFKKQWSYDELINLIANLAPEKQFKFQRGLGWSYSNHNYILAGMLIEAVTHHTVEEEMQKRLFNPLHLTHTYYIPDIYHAWILQQMAHGYEAAGMFPDEPKDVTNFNYSMGQTAGDILSTSHDMAIWLNALMTGSVLPPKQQQEFLSTVSTQNGQPQPIGDNHVGYGLGISHNDIIESDDKKICFDFFGQERWGHEGGIYGYQSHMIWLKENNVVITILINHVAHDTEKGISDIDHILIDLVSTIQRNIEEL